jgi:predicted ATPase/DNA-binding CsgD family transcriptional regulator
MLVERHIHIEQLQELLAEAGRGKGRVVVLSGEAGVGKSTLAQAFAETAEESARILWSACEDLTTPDPLGPLHDLARDAKWNLPQALDKKGSRLAVFSECLGIFNDPVHANLLIIEDLHWADNATLDFVRFLGRRVRNTHILLLITARNDEPGGHSNIRRALTDIPSNNVIRIDVPALTEQAVIKLARDKGFDGKALFQTTAGNAYFVTELLRARRGDGLPPTVRDAVLARADRLSALARAVLDAVSIFPRWAEAFAVEALCGEQHAVYLDECITQGILNASGDTYAFRHEIARRAIELALTPSRRQALNAQALAILRANPDISVARLVHHAQEANDWIAVRGLASIAGDEASRLGAHREAAGHFILALKHTDSLSIDERKALYEKHAFESHLVGQLEQAIRSRNILLEIHRTAGEALKEGDCLRWLSRLNYLAGNRIAAERYANEAVTLLESLPHGAELAMAYSTLSQLAMVAGDNDEALAQGRKALALIEQKNLNRPDILCHALNNVGFSQQWQAPDHGRSLLDRSLEIAMANDFQENVARFYTNRASFEFEQLADGQAKAFLETGISYCIERDLDTWRDYMRGILAMVLLRQGQCNDAEETAMVVISNDDATPLMRYRSVMALATLRTRRGEPADALLAELSKFLETGLEFQRIMPYALLISERAWLGQADRTEALQLLERVEAMAPDAGATSEIFLWKSTLGAHEGAPQAQHLREPFRNLLSSSWLAVADAWQGIGAPFEQALCLLEGNPDAQRQALAIFESLGATAVVEHVQQMMQARGLRIAARGPRASTRANQAGLTKRQMDVLRLIDQGRSNTDIANTLFVSPKTVDHHISAILGKLAAKSRGEAAAIARGAGLMAE